MTCFAAAISALLCSALMTQAGKPPRDPEPCFDVPFMFGNIVLASFANNGEYQLPGHDVVVADFTGDSIADVASVSASGSLFFPTGFFSFFKANGDGTFTPPVMIPTAEYLAHLTANDFDRDGDLDIAIAQQFSKCDDPAPTQSTVLILLNDGAGNFTSQLGTGPIVRLAYIASGDLTGDGRPEIVVGRFTCGLEPPAIYVLLNNGLGQFPASTEFFTSALTTQSIAIGDVDGDRDNDLVLGTGDESASQLELFRNAGDGSFLPREDLPLVGGLGMDEIDLADIDGDGDLDAVVDFESTVEQKQGIALNNGAGVFSTPTVIPLGRPNGAAQFVGDLTGDGRPDIVTGVSAFTLPGGDGDEFVLLTNTGGAFAASAIYHAGIEPNVFAAGDVTGDGVTDVVVGIRGSNRNGGCTVFAGAKGGQLSGDQIYPLIPGFTQNNVAAMALTSGDVDNDGDTDLLGCRGLGNDGVARVLLNDGAGAFDFGPTVPTGDRLNRMTLVDLNNDGPLDLVVLLIHDAEPSCHVQVHMGLGKGEFGPARQDMDIVGSATGGDIDAADVNGDGWMDVVASPAWEEPIAILDGPPGPPMRVNVLLNDGAGGLLPATAYDVSPPVHIQPGVLTPRGLCDAAIGDLNGDKHPDIAAVIDIGRKLSVLMNNGDGTFGPFTTYVPSSTNPTGVAMGDMDGDSDLDIVTANRGDSEGGHSFSVFLNDGSGALATPIDWPISVWNVGSSRWEMVLADLDGDGALDAAVAGQEVVSIRRGADDGTLLPETLTASAHKAYASLLAADLNDDGRLDLATGTTQRSTADPNIRTGVSIMLNHCCAAAAPCPADTNNSGSVDVDDLIAVILGWGPCGKPQNCAGDVNNSGAVDVDDLIAVILGWGPCS
jgi:hypothetical protein